MSNNRGTHNATRRFRLVAILMPFIALTLFSFWLVEVMRRSGEESAPPVKRTEPDVYVENFSYVRISKQGTPQYHFSGTRLTHNPQDDSYDIEQPIVHGVDDKRAPMTLRADHAKVNNDHSEVRLMHDVNLDRPATATSEHMHVKSDYMLLLPDDDVVRTDKPVEIIIGASKLTGTGMYLNNATREFRLNSNVHGTYQPVPR